MTGKIGSHVFERSGVAALSDLATDQWRELFQYLEREQSLFLEKEGVFRSAEYAWPRDALHTWSRVWEYPYAYYHLKRWRGSFARPAQPRVVDFGSGVTFFPFAVAKLGCHVTCVDVDPVCRADLERAAEYVAATPGKVDCCLSSGALPLRDGEAEALYCVSVLEHIPHFEDTLSEIVRVLKPGGLFVLTIDLDLRGDQAIGTEAYAWMARFIHEHFVYLCPVTTTHPADTLRSWNGPFPMRKRNLARFLVMGSLRRLAGKRHGYRVPFDLTVEGLVLLKKEQAACARVR